jgi:serine/threonine protein phosphatase PrpC
MLKFTAAGKSHPGKRRENNEDSLLVLPECRLFVVADGMGGHAAGEVASGMVVSVLEEVCRGAFGSTEESAPPPEPDQVLNTALTTANRKVFRQGMENPAQRGMGSTATVLLVGDDDCYTLGHVGDSRIYRFFDGEITQLTTDHSLVQEQQDLGLLKEEDAATHRLKNVITRSIGGREEVEVDTARGRCGDGDIFLLCSDGFSNEVTPAEMAAILSGPGSLEEKADRCIDLANEKDGTDNITVVLVSAGNGSADRDAQDANEAAGERVADETTKTVISGELPDLAPEPEENVPPKKRGRILGVFFFFVLFVIIMAWIYVTFLN